MNSELLLRLSQIKQYISSLNDSIAVSNHSNAAAVVTRFKKAMSKSEEHVHANQFILDCLRTRNEKLRTELYDLEQEKKAMEGRITAAKSAPRQIRETRAEICITRLTLSLGESKKVDYEEVTFRSDYKHVFVSSTLGQKYRDYAISIEQAQQLEHRGPLLYFCAIGEQVIHVIVKFKSDRDAYRWSTCLRHAQLALKNARKKDRLFEEHKDPVPVAYPPANVPPPAPVFANTTNLPPPLRSSMVKSTLGLPQVPFLNFNSQARVSPSESGISEKRFTDKSYEREADKSGEKNTERSLVNALNYQAVRSSGAFNIKESAPVGNYEKRLDLNRPPNLAKVRNNSNHDYSSTLDTLKVHKGGYRKQSEDIIKPHINQAYHEKMMENYLSQEEQEEVRSQAPFPATSSPPHEKSQKLRTLEERKKELLKPSQHLTIEKPFLFDSKVTWMGIKETEDENKSKSSNRISNKSRRGSEFSESAVGGSSEHIKRETEDNHSEHITEKSQEESPKLPKHTYQVPVPQKYAYPNGIVFQLHQVDKAQTSSPLLPSKDENTPERLHRPSSSSSLDSDDDDHSDPSSHENHTESEDNNARSQQLKKGIILTKCSENGFWTHEKILYLSENNSELCSRDLKDKKIKKIKIANIKDVEYKKFDKGIIKHVSKIEEDKCFVIRALDDEGNIKNYEFIGNIAEPLEHFANNLKLFVEYTKKE